MPDERSDSDAGIIIEELSERIAILEAEKSITGLYNTKGLSFTPTLSMRSCNFGVIGTVIGLILFFLVLSVFLRMKIR